MTVDPNLAIDTGTAFSLAGLLYVVLAMWAAIHVLLNKQNPGSAFSWLGVIVLSPFFGAAIYWLFGINRIKRRARAERQVRVPDVVTQPANEEHAVPAGVTDQWQRVMRAGLSIHSSSYVNHNSVEPLINGVEAYPVMLAAIDDAQSSVVLSSYIFEYDAVGERFVEALSAARARGVEVQVLIDGLGVGYGWSLIRADRMLRKEGVTTARFLSALSASGTRFINLRNHRKILSVDGRVAYIGGMNIRAGNLLDGLTPHQTQDIHFAVSGPVLDQVNAVFEDDWQFATGDALALPKYAAGTECRENAGVICRVLIDGPDDNYQKLRLSLLSTINAAVSRIRIVTPYFLPGEPVLDALLLAVLRGVDVELVLPGSNNLKYVDWAMLANESRLLENGIKIYRTPPPFDHSKLFVVDNEWCVIGSSNWDARSLDLNFEINLECYDNALNRRLSAVVDEKIATARVVRPRRARLPARLRNTFFRLFSPYL